MLPGLLSTLLDLIRRFKELISVVLTEMPEISHQRYFKEWDVSLNSEGIEFLFTENVLQWFVNIS